MGNPRASSLTISVTLVEALRRVSDSFVSTGMPQDLARIAADVIVETEAHGVATHGLSMLPQYLRELEAGVMNPSARPEVVYRQAGIARVDGGGSLGHLGAVLACETAQEIAWEFGIGMVAVGSSNHAGCFGHYARLLSKNGLVGLIFGTSIPSMVAVGGRTRVLGNNPLAVGVPTLEAPIVLDMAMSMVARRRISLAAERSEVIPAGWALDSQGVPTESPREALSGSLESFGGVKASGLAVVVGMLASGFGGAGFGLDLGDLDQGPKPGVNGLSVIAINPEFFGLETAPISIFTSAVNSLRVDGLGGLNPDVRLPGDGSRSRYAASIRSGLLVNKALWKEITQRASQSGGG